MRDRERHLQYNRRRYERMKPPAAAKEPRGIMGPNLGSGYSDEQREFLKAIESYKRRNRRPYPRWDEVLAVAHSLGYRKVTEA